jgi:signal transduction histidine kinase
MLTVSKIESGGFNPVLEPVNILDLIIEQFPGYQLHAQRDDIALHLSIPDQLPLALADSSLIGRVLDNLVTNAIKYTKTKGEIRIEALQTDDWLEVRVQDDGQGIREEYQESIFNKFAQLPADSNGSIRQGVGLGLTFCRLAIEAHNGRIWVNSSLNQGSTFHFTLPIAP